jgi:hypothetical protein
MLAEPEETKLALFPAWQQPKTKVEKPWRPERRCRGKTTPPRGSEGGGAAYVKKERPPENERPNEEANEEVQKQKEKGPANEKAQEDALPRNKEPSAEPSSPRKRKRSPVRLSDDQTKFAECVRRSLAFISGSSSAIRNCYSEEFRMRVYACALRLLDSIKHCPSLSKAQKADDVKVVAQAIYGIAFAFEDDKEVSDHKWTRRSKGIDPQKVAEMEHRVIRLFWTQGQGGLKPCPCRNFD